MHILEEIKSTFENNGYKMRKPILKQDNIRSRGGDIYFQMKSNGKVGFIFEWETPDEGNGHFDEKFQRIKALYPCATIRPGERNKNYRRIDIPINQENARKTKLNEALDIVNCTKTIIGY